MSKYQELKEALSNHENQIQVDRYINYCKVCEANTKNHWMPKLSASKLSEMYNQVSNEGLVFDGIHITIQSRGITYDYVAYKNKMLIAYPETTIDMQMVYSDDTFSFSKLNGCITYQHDFGNPFQQTEDDIVGGYCIIKNKRGEFITTLSKADFDKHKKIAKTQFIWNGWYKEMCFKTLIRKSVKVHFDDVYEGINKTDNVNYDLAPKTAEGNTGVIVNELLLDKITNAKDGKELLTIYNENKAEIVKDVVLTTAIGKAKKELGL